MASIDIKIAPTKLVAAILGVTSATVINLHKRGIFEQTAKGKYDLVTASAAYRKWQRQNSKGSDLGLASLDLRREQARRLKLDNDQKVGRLIPLDDVQEFGTVMAGLFTRGVETLKRRVAAVVPQKNRKLVDDECRTIRQGIADQLTAIADGKDTGGDSRPGAG